MTSGPEPDWRDVDARVARLVEGAALAGRRVAALNRARSANLWGDAAARLDDRMRALLGHHLAGMVTLLERSIRMEATRLLLAQGERAAAARLEGERDTAWTHLTAAGQLGGAALAGELIARLRHDLITERLPVRAGNDDEPSLLVRLSNVADAAVATAARSLLVAETRRREALAMAEVERTDLPAELHQPLVWRVAAAIRGKGGAPVDRALADAALRLLATYDEGDRPEAHAMRLAFAIDARSHELPALLDEAIGDRRLSLVIAVLASAAGLGFDQVRALVVEPGDERWWLLLRAIDLDPLTVARLSLALAQADPHRASDDLPSLLETVNAVTPAHARAALATMRLPRDFCDAIDTLNSERTA